MTIESRELFELCKQVYEATGWESDELHWMIDTGSPVPFVSLSPGKKQAVEETDYPLYTSDYLLEKLPHTLSDNDGDRYTITVHKVGDSWLANYTLDNVGMHHIYADTPLKALIKLTLKLYEEGLL